MQSFSNKTSQSKTGKAAKEKVLHQLTKTTLCNFFNAGSCPAGAGCKFAHGEEELQAKPNFCKTSLCKAWKAGKCKKTAAKCFFAHGYSDIRTTSSFQQQSGKAEDPRKNRAEFWKRLGDKSKGAAATTTTAAEEARPDGLDLEFALQARAAEGKSDAAGRSRSSSESSESSEDGSGRESSSEQQLDASSSASSSTAVAASTFGDSLRIDWSAPVGNKLRWADVSDEEFSDSPDDLPRCDSALSQASTAVPSSASEATIETSASFETLTTSTLEIGGMTMQGELPMPASRQAQPDQQPCVLSIHSMLPVGNGQLQQQQVMPMPYFEGRTADPMQHHRIVMVPVLLPEQYFMQTAAGQGDHVAKAAESSFEATAVSCTVAGVSLEE
eukprot:TRINITY_DN2969_c0_g1_i1.p1 TRINITY_DN2969_c0_g1~~TRINITY_DN2969_c0_g1_i1.p1  ORF type:complete len:408 (+),score=111.40 TRINITY_DN2969_c0_g1_i1:71-1225(+)